MTLYGRPPRAGKIRGVLNLRLGTLQRRDGSWYACRHSYYLERPLRFDDLGSALRFLGYNPRSMEATCQTKK